MLKNLEKLNGFHISPTTPIEMIYDTNCKLEGYSLLLERENYPLVMYGKFDINFDLTEFYPWKFGKLSDKNCVNIILKNHSFKTKEISNFVRSYFSVNAETLKIEDFYVNLSGVSLKKFNYKTKEIKTEYSGIIIENKPNILLENNIQLKHFVEKIKPHYGWIYLSPNINMDIKKILVGYSFSTDSHLEKYNELHLYDIIKKSYELIK